MRTFPGLAVIEGGLALLAPPAHGQDDAMEFQRCIWRCLANSNGADDPAYQQCVTDVCDGGAPAYSAPPEGRWGYGHHPVLGLSAHINVDGHALGFACIAVYWAMKCHRGAIISLSAATIFATWTGIFITMTDGIALFASR